MSGSSWRTPGVGARDVNELLGRDPSVSGWDVLGALLIDLIVYPFSAWLLRGFTGQSVGDRMMNLVYVRAKTGGRPGVLRCIGNDALALISLPLEFFALEILLALFSQRIMGIEIDKVAS